MRTRDPHPPARGFPSWAGPEAQLRHLLGYAIRAPSRYNSQPWLFDVEGDELSVVVDRRRWLRSADPQGREAAIACGAALENVRIAAHHHGRDARIDTAGCSGGGPAARLWLDGWHSPGPVEERLFQAIPRRRTSLALRAGELQPRLLAALADEAAGLGCALRPLRAAQQRPVAGLCAEADAVLWANPRFRAEHALWCRPAGAAGQPWRGRPAGVLGRLQQQFAGAELQRRLARHLDGLLVLSTRSDEPADWIAAGRALQRVLLWGAAHGMEASYLSQATEVPEVRARLRRALFDAGYPQVLLRLGRGTVLRTPKRRPVELVLRSFAPAVPLVVAESEVEAA